MLVWLFRGNKSNTRQFKTPLWAEEMYIIHFFTFFLHFIDKTYNLLDKIIGRLIKYLMLQP